MEILFIAYDNESHISYFPIGIGYLASVLRAKGHTVTIYNQDVYHYPEDHLVNFLERNHFDLVGIGVVGGYYQYRKLLKISQAIKRVRRRPFFVIGGHGPSAEPEFFLRRTQADAVVVGEGEIILANLVDAIENKLERFHLVVRTGPDTAVPLYNNTPVCFVHCAKKRRSAASASSPTTKPSMRQRRRAKVQRHSVAASKPINSATSRLPSKRSSQGACSR